MANLKKGISVILNESETGRPLPAPGDPLPACATSAEPGEAAAPLPAPGDVSPTGATPTAPSQSTASHAPGDSSPSGAAAITSPATGDSSPTGAAPTSPSPVGPAEGAAQYSRITQETLRRKKSIPRTNGCTYYLSDEHIMALARIKCFNGIDKQDVVRTALQEFLAKYASSDGVCLGDRGVRAVSDHVIQK